MTWRVRLAEAKDYDAVRDLAKMNHAESCPDMEWCGARARETFFQAYLEDSQLMIWVVEKDSVVCGFLQAAVCEYRTFVGHFTAQEVLFVRPDKRGTRAAALLMKQFVDWSDRIGATEIIGGNDNDIHSEQTARFLSRFGFRAVGCSMKRRLDEHRKKRV